MFHCSNGHLHTMGLFKKSLPVCPENQHCAQWARVYMKYCLCGFKDEISLTLGLVSVISWGIAEVPQIITNCREKSTEGLSVAFQMTWVVGDLFNLFGCMLESDTLPTQYYTAFLYTVTTVVLLGQTVYYGHIYRHLKVNRKSQHPEVSIVNEAEAGFTRKKKHGNFVGKQHNSDCSQINVSDVVEEGTPQTSSPIPVAASVNPHHLPHEKDLYYMSARSLTRSHTPTAGSYSAHSQSRRITPIQVIDQQSFEEPLLGVPVNIDSASPSNSKSLLCVASAVIFFLGSFNLHLSQNHKSVSVSGKQPGGIIIQVRRMLVQSSDGVSLIQVGSGGSSIGTILGWAMAAIYMGGRLPQICLNIRRGHVDGLNPLMFIFALFGNLTYVASILVNSVDWCKIKSNLPWLVDAGGCAILDSFILLQFIYFRWRKSKGSNSDHDHFVAA